MSYIISNVFYHKMELERAYYRFRSIANANLTSGSSQRPSSASFPVKSRVKLAHTFDVISHLMSSLQETLLGEQVMF